MGAQLTYLKQPIVKKDVVDGQVPERARYGACGMQGWRRGMEDAHIAVPKLTEDGRCSLFGVFDGHGGCGVARFAAQHLPDILLATEEFQKADYAAALSSAFLAVDQRLLTLAGREELRDLDKAGRVPLVVNRKKYSQLARPGMHRLPLQPVNAKGPDENTEEDDVLIDPGLLRETSPEGQGATAVVALIVWDEPTQSSSSGGRLIIANAGDSRCIYGRSTAEGKVLASAMSEDHKPELKTEAERIKAAGGQITMMPGGARINGDLNLSRAIGDFRHKQRPDLPAEQQVVTSSPEVRECALGPDRRLLVLGCDGIWERNQNQQLMNRLHESLGGHGEKPLLSSLGAEVCDSSLCPSMNPGENPSYDGSGCDNMTILIVEFNQNGNGTADESIPAAEATTREPSSTTDERKVDESASAAGQEPARATDEEMQSSSSSAVLLAPVPAAPESALSAEQLAEEGLADTPVESETTGIEEICPNVVAPEEAAKDTEEVVCGNISSGEVATEATREGSPPTTAGSERVSSVEEPCEKKRKLEA